MTTTATRITAIGTVRIPVTNQDRAFAFYRDVLGFETRVDAAFDGSSRWLEVAPAGAQTSIALVPESPDDPSGIPSGISLTTLDAAADRDQLASQGVAVGELLVQPIPMFTFRDPDGNTLRVVQRPPGA